MFASPSAAATTITFDDGLVKLGGLSGPVDVVDAAKPVTLATDIAPDGNFTVAPAQFDFPAYTSQVLPGQNLTVDVIPEADVTGNYNRVSGLLTTSTSTYTVDVDLSGLVSGSCTISPIPLALSTESTTPFQGDRFDSGSVPPLNGAVVGSWLTLPSVTGDPACGVVNTISNGAGGIRLSRGAAPAGGPPAPSGPPLGSGETEEAVPQLKCRRRGRYRGRTSQGEQICFNVSRKRGRRRVAGVTFNWTGRCDVGTAEGTFTGFRGVSVRRDGSFESSDFNTDLTFVGKIKGRRARGTLRVEPSRGGCDSGRVRWSARRG